MSEEEKGFFSASKKIRDQRIQIYLDCIIGSVLSIFALSCLIAFAVLGEYMDPGYFIFSMTFWSIWLTFSLFLITLGIYTYYKAKKGTYGLKHKDKLRAPIR